jgi:cell division protein FtsX
MPMSESLRRNVRLATTAILIVSLALVVVAFLINEGAGDNDPTAEADRSSESGEGPGDLGYDPKYKGKFKAIIYMDVDISDEQRRALESTLDQDPAIKSFEYLDRAAAYEEFQILFKDSPEMLEDVDPEALPTSFKLVPEDPSPESVLQIKESYEDEPGVLKVSTRAGIREPDDTPSWQEDVRAIVFLDPDVSEEQRRALEATLEADPAIKSFVYLDKAAAEEEFERLFKESPEFTEGVDPAELPTSFHLVPEDASFESVLRIKASYEDEPGVYRVVTGME